MLFKTHYYGGIRNTSGLPSSGASRVVALKNGTVVDIVIGKDKNDPVFVITDLLPHLASEQNKTTVRGHNRRG